MHQQPGKERTMRKVSQLSGVFVATMAALFVAPLFADGGGHKSNFQTGLTGYQETPLTLNSGGSGQIKLKISKDGASIDYELSYRDLPSAITQSHIHFGRPALTGGIVLFLCTNLAPPSGVPLPQNCPPPPATITGTLTAADVRPVPGQGIDAGTAGFAEMINAIRSGAAYANVHTAVFPGGEIRGALGLDDEDD
jgi:hypothetical protein